MFLARQRGDPHPRPLLGRMRDVRAIEQLKYRYANYCDNGYDPEGIASLFTSDGIWVVNGVAGDVAGADASRHHFRELSKAISWALHFVIAPQVELTRDRQSAVGKFYLLCHCTNARTDAPQENDAVVLTLNYVDQFVKQGERWLFKELRGTMHQASTWELGWVKQLRKRDSDGGGMGERGGSKGAGGRVECSRPP